MSDIGKEAAVEPGDHLSSSPEITLGTCSESLKLELSESVGVLSSSLNEKKEEKINCDVHDDEAEGEHSNSVLSKRTHISPSDSDSEEIESKKIKLSEDESQRRKSVQVIKVVNKTSDLDVSVIDLISDKDYSSTVEVTTNGGESLDDEDLFSDSPPSKQNINSQKELSSLNKNQDHCTPVNEQPKSAVSSVEFNERETYSSTPYVLNTKTIPNKRSHDNQQNKSESATEDILPNENIYFVQINDVSILKGIKSMSGIGPIYKASHVPDPSFLKDVLEWEKTDIKNLIHLSKSGRVSDASSLSTISSKVSSTGYSADQSSAGSGLSENNKRDRISIAPEATIPHHKVIAKLPVFKNTPKVILEDLTSVSHLEKDKSDTTTKKKSLRKTKMKGSKLIVSPDKSFSEISSNDSIIHIGLDVFAKWTEGKRGIRYYLGRVTEKDTLEEHKWRILFHDGVEKVLKESELISSESLVPGKYVNVEVEKNCIRRAIIISHPIPNEDNICYSVEFETDDDKSVEQSSLVPVSRLHLDMEQVKEMASELGQFPKGDLSSCTGGDLDLNNIVFTKRTRPSRFPVTPIKSKKKGGKYVDTSTAETSCSETPKSSVASKKKLLTSKVKCKMAKSTTETEDDECSSPSLRKKGRKPRKIDSTRLFRKMNFILTKTNTKHPAYGLDTETDLGEESSSSDDNYDREKMEVDPFNKYEIKSLILKYGGVVLNSFPGENSKFPKKDEELYIVSDKSCRTLNFLYGIAHGVPPISFQWILDSVRGTKKFPIANYLLPLGYSETKGFEIEQGACESRPLFKLLDKLKILVFGKAAEDWKVFLVRLGAKVYSQKTEAVSSLSRHVLNKINVVLMTDDEDNQHVPDILSNITVVSPRWIIQSLINREKLDFDLFIVK
ncbi:TP53-binding protein 1 [Lepeophtheirus salmonis]|uniref:TP53-binding protein 1 n=1 Tax=Lepeophtheirus salmonis TaxID=72036 RepID=UPI001AE285C9|nr:TP53-binding protein 1-like [Lepeophtheirus salmonis]